MPVMVLFQVFLEERDWRELLILFTWLSVDFYPALVLGQLLESFSTLLVYIKNVSVDLIRKDFGLYAWKRLEFGHYDHLFAGGLSCIKDQIPCKWGKSCSCWWLSFCRCIDSRWVRGCILRLRWTQPLRRIKCILLLPFLVDLLFIKGWL